MLRAAQFPEDARPARPSGPARFLYRDLQFLHRDRLQQGRRADPDAPHPARARSGSAPAATSISSATTAQAVTCEDFVRAMEEASGERSRPSSGSGTSRRGRRRVTARLAPRGRHGAAARSSRRCRRRRASRTSSRCRSRSGSPCSATRPATSIERAAGPARQGAGRSCVFEAPARPAVLSINRGFSAPVIVETDRGAGRSRLPLRP